MSNYGLIILLLTVIIKIGLLPLTYKSYLSQARMKVLKPQVDELNHKYPKGKEVEKQQATMALYKKAGVSPMGGCLPMLLQFPILFAMFRFFPTSIELRQQGFLWAKDLSTYDAIISWHHAIPGPGKSHQSVYRADDHFHHRQHENERYFIFTADTRHEGHDVYNACHVHVHAE